MIKQKWNSAKRILSICLMVLLILNLMQMSEIFLFIYTVHAEQVARVTVGITNVNVRQEPNTTSEILTVVNGGQLVTILDDSNIGWYHVAFTKNGTSYDGYISATYITIEQEDPSYMEDFEAYLTAQEFPESYKENLRELHTLHPEWKFVALHTGLDWNTVIANERNKQGQIKNLVQGTAVAPHYNWRETSVGYNWATDSWSAYDGTTWFAASQALVEYYMDPRTYLYETYIFAFEQLSYDTEIHTKSGVESILNGTFMYDSSPSQETMKYSEIIMEAAGTYDVSPYHLASRMKQEMGTSAGVNATGTSSNYPGIYNLFNIGAVDSAGGGAVNKGLAWASLTGSYGRPWNSAYKAIMGGAQYIGTSYINRGQDTLYTQKFNVTYKGNLYNHQYMSNLQAPAVEASGIYRAYNNNGLINSALVFKIPVYTNMPETASVKPADSGSPNHWLKSLAISDYTLTPTFQGETTSYSLIVNYDVTSVTVVAQTVNAKASVNGTGMTELAVGNNVIPITVTAQNGDQRIYEITVIRRAQNEEPITPPTEEPTETPTEPTTEHPVEPTTEEPVNPGSSEPTFQTTYTVNGDLITGITPGTTAETFIQALGASSDYTVTVYEADGKTVNFENVGTGNIVKIYAGTKSYTYTVLLYGDVSGDGIINALDLLKVQKHIIGSNSLSGIYLQAANVKKSGSLSALDLLKLQKHIIGASTIEQ